MSTTFGPKSLPTNTAMAGGTIVRRRFVMQGADENTGVQATAAALVIGISYDNQDAVGEPFPIVDEPGKTCLLELGGTVTTNDRLTPNATGQGVLATVGQPVAAVAKEPGTSGKYIVVQYVNSRVATAP